LIQVHVDDIAGTVELQAKENLMKKDEFEFFSSLAKKTMALEPSHGEVEKGLKLDRNFYLWKDGDNICLAKFNDPEFHEELIYGEEKEAGMDWSMFVFRYLLEIFQLFKISI
jgi:hypothetical protein